MWAQVLCGKGVNKPRVTAAEKLQHMAGNACDVSAISNRGSEVQAIDLEGKNISLKSSKIKITALFLYIYGLGIIL